MQLEFALRDEDALERDLEERTGRALCLTVTDNSSTVMAVRPKGADDRLNVRLHRMFLSAGPGVIAAVADWVMKPRGRRAGVVLKHFIRANQHQVVSRVKAQSQLSVRGVHYDLAALFDAVNRAHFGGQVTARITWGRMPTSRPRRSIRFGSYSAEEDLIRIHPLLDQDSVPEYFVRYIVFHEMLHAHVGIAKGENGRSRIHSAEFKKREKGHPDYERAVAWQADPKHLRRLLRRLSGG